MTVSLTLLPAREGSPGSADELLGRLVRERIRPLLDEALDQLWTAGFALMEAAERSVERSAANSRRARRIEEASTALFKSLDRADVLYCGLAELCALVQRHEEGRR